MPCKSVQFKDVKWDHISQVNEKDFEFLQSQFKFHNLDYEDIRAETHLSKIDAYKHYLFFVFHIPTFQPKSNTVSREELYVFLADKKIVTVTHKPLVAVDSFLKRMQDNARFSSSILSKGSAYLMYQILTEAFRQSREIVTAMTQEVTRLEEGVNNRSAKAITVDLGKARRNILYVRHIIDPQRTMIASLVNIKRPFIPENVHIYFDDLKDTLDTIWLSVDNLKLLLDGLFDVNEALLSHRTNEVITILTIISASFMVPTFIAGFYGMNVPWLPFAHNPLVISFLYLFSFVSIFGIVIYIMRRSRL